MYMPLGIWKSYWLYILYCQTVKENFSEKDSQWFDLLEPGLFWKTLILYVKIYPLIIWSDWTFCNTSSGIFPITSLFGPLFWRYRTTYISKNRIYRSLRTWFMIYKVVIFVYQLRISWKLIRFTSPPPIWQGVKTIFLLWRIPESITLHQ